MTYNQANEDLTIHRNINVDNTYKVQSNIFNSNGDNNLIIQRNGVPFLTFQSDRITMADGFTLYNDILINNTISTDQVLSDRFRCKNTNVDVNIDGGNATEDGRIAYMSLRRLTEDIRVLRDIKIDAGKKNHSNVYDSSDDNDVYFKRNDINYLQFEGVSNKVRVLSGFGIESDVYHSKKLSGATFRWLGGDFFYLKNCNLELNTNIGLKTDTIDTIGNTNLVVKQNGSTILYYDVGDATYPNGIFKFDKDVSINTTKYIQCNTIKAHIFDTHDSLEPNDVSFRYNGTTYMFYDQSLSNFQVRTDIASNQDITCVALTETSDKRLKENIDDFHSNCSEIIKTNQC